MTSIRVTEISGRADTADQGSRLHKALQEALKKAGPVVIDFEGINTATSSFTNLSFVQLLRTRRLGELKGRLRVVNSTRQINEMIKSRLERVGGEETSD